MNEYDIRYQWLAHGESGTLIITDDYTDAQRLHSVASLALELTRHDYRPPFSIQYRHKNPVLMPSTLGKKLIYCITKDYEKCHASFSNHKLSPIIKTIMEKIAEKDIQYRKEQKGSFIEETRVLTHTPPDQCTQIAEEYNNFASELRTLLLDSGMRERIKSFKRNTKERYKQFIRGCSSAVNRHSKCLAMRLDTASRKVEYPRLDFSEITQESFVEQCREINKHRNDFIKHLNLTFGKELAFYAWKIEYGVIRGFHVHWFILLNGNKYQDRINIPMLLGEHWKNIITNGNGTYHNVNRKHSSQTSGLRVLHHADADLWDHLEGIASYLTKVDYHIKIILPDNMRSFGCSKASKQHRIKPGPKRRAPQE